jgi:hypothetical protein
MRYTVETDIKALGDLKDGWFGGDGVAYSKKDLRWLCGLFFDYPEDIPTPHIAPLPLFKVSLEWVCENYSKRIEYTLELDLTTKVGRLYRLEPNQVATVDQVAISLEDGSLTQVFDILRKTLAQNTVTVGNLRKSKIDVRKDIPDGAPVTDLRVEHVVETTSDGFITVGHKVVAPYYMRPSEGWNPKASECSILQWVAGIYKLEEVDCDAAQHEIFYTIDKFCTEGNFKDCDTILQVLDLNRLNTNLIISFLTITLPAKQHLQSRKQFFEKVVKHFEVTEPSRDVQLLMGLD